MLHCRQECLVYKDSCSQIKDMNFYTGFPDRSVFEVVFEYLEPGKEGEIINYWHSIEDSTVHTNQNCEENIPKQGRPRLLDPKEEFALVDNPLQLSPRHFNQNFNSGFFN